MKQKTIYKINENKGVEDMGEEKQVFAGEVALSTPYGVVYIRNQGREVTFKLYDSISQNEHHKRLFKYVQWLSDQGIKQINCDHIYYDWLDRSLSLRRGSRILDIVYFQNGKLFECELKTSREIWLDHTAQQLKEFERHCENLIVLVPKKDMETTRSLLKSLNLLKTKIDSYEI